MTTIYSSSLARLDALRATVAEASQHLALALELIRHAQGLPLRHRDLPDSWGVDFSLAADGAENVLYQVRTIFDHVSALKEDDRV